MSKAKAIILGIFTVWPIVYIVFAMCTMFVTMIFEFTPPIVFMILATLHFLTMLDIFALITIYIIHIFKTDKVRQDKKTLWAVVIFLGHAIAMPIYWYHYIWKTQQEPAVLEQNTDQS